MTFRAGIGPIARRRALSVLKGIALAVLAVGGVVVLLLLAAHLPWVQARVTTWALSKLETRGIRVRTRVLTYNLATRSVHVEGLAVSTTADAQQPFVEADRIDATLPRSVFTGRLAITSLRGDNLRVVIVRHQDGSTNLPQGRDDGPAGSSSFPIDTLTLPNMSVVWRDDVVGMGVDAKAVSVNLAGGRGTFAFGRPATLRAGDHETSVAAGAQIAWDGAKLSFDSLRLQAPEATLTAAGSVGLLAAGRPLAVEGSGSVDLDRVTHGSHSVSGRSASCRFKCTPPARPAIRTPTSRLRRRTSRGRASPARRSTPPCTSTATRSTLDASPCARLAAAQPGAAA